jgi:hypothetical protein
VAVNSMDYSGKDTVLDVIRTESGKFFKIVDNPQNWNVQTRCTEWEVRDMVGHMLDVTEGYLSRWQKAEKGRSRHHRRPVGDGRLAQQGRPIFPQAAA